MTKRKDLGPCVCIWQFRSFQFDPLFDRPLVFTRAESNIVFTLEMLPRTLQSLDANLAMDAKEYAVAGVEPCLEEDPFKDYFLCQK